MRVLSWDFRFVRCNGLQFYQKPAVSSNEKSYPPLSRENPESFIPGFQFCLKILAKNDFRQTKRKGETFSGFHHNGGDQHPKGVPH
ncbi:MAG: hypothetical protein ACI4QT_03365, partial [Kiritimatiellia bacterium]